MIKKALISFILCSTLSACAFQDTPCEDITIISNQLEQCAQLHRQIISAKGNPIARTELERRYQLDCVESRYYRDAHGGKACSSKEREEQAMENKKNN